MQPGFGTVRPYLRATDCRSNCQNKWRAKKMWDGTRKHLITLYLLCPLCSPPLPLLRPTHHPVPATDDLCAWNPGDCDSCERNYSLLYTQILSSGWKKMGFLNRRWLNE